MNGNKFRTLFRFLRHHAKAIVDDGFSDPLVTHTYCAQECLSPTTVFWSKQNLVVKVRADANAKFAESVVHVLTELWGRLAAAAAATHTGKLARYR